MTSFRMRIDGQADDVAADSETSLFAAMARAGIAWPVSCRNGKRGRLLPALRGPTHGGCGHRPGLMFLVMPMGFLAWDEDVGNRCVGGLMAA